jgi:hypothetical protein
MTKSPLSDGLLSLSIKLDDHLSRRALGFESLIAVYSCISTEKLLFCLNMY